MRGVGRALGQVDRDDSMKERPAAVANAALHKLRGNHEIMPATGARPTGAADEAGAARAVRQMFDSIAPRYDLLNHVLSANVDRLWWRRAARRFRDVLARPEAQILDICCGTGDLTMALLKLRPRGARPDSGRRLCARHAAPRSAEVWRAEPRDVRQRQARPQSLTRSPSRPMRSICRCAPSRSI